MPKNPVISIVEDDLSVREAGRSHTRAVRFPAEVIQSVDDLFGSDRFRKTSCLITDTDTQNVGTEPKNPPIMAGKVGDNVVGMAAARAAHVFVNPDSPRQVVINANADANHDPGPQNAAVPDNLSSLKGQPPTDVGGMPLFCNSFNIAPTCIQIGTVAMSATTSGPSRLLDDEGIAFERYRIFPRLNLLLCEGDKIPIGQRAFDVLWILVKANGDLISKDDLISTVWSGVVVEDNNLQAQISAVRRALGPDREMIRTEFGRGYRLVAGMRTQAALMEFSRCSLFAHIP